MTYPQSDLTGLAVDEVGMRLLRAAEIIRERGWCQGQISDEFGHVCTFGAIVLASGATDLAVRAGQPPLEAIENELKMCQRLRCVGVESVWGIGGWNDAPERTVDDVLAALTAAALSHAAQE